MNQSIYQHFLPEEREFIEKIRDMIGQMEASYAYQLTEFLDPRQVEIASSVLGQAGVKYFLSTEICPMEATRLIIAPDYYQLDVADFDLTLLEIHYPTKFYDLSHRQVLGALMNQLGMRRSTFGDILVDDKRVQLIFDRSKLDYLVSQVSKIARVPVSFEEVDFAQVLTVEEGSDQLIISSSLRLDKVIAVMTKQSRSQVGKLLEQGKVKCNHAPITNGSRELALGDLISLRGYGRFQLKEDLGLTKQGKYKLLVRAMIAKK